MRLCKT